jgi:hypothetical protein
MLKATAFLALTAVLVAPLSGQTPSATPTQAPETTSAPATAQTPAPAPAMCADAITLDDLIKALDEAVSGPADKDRSCMRELLLPEARLSRIGKHPDGMYAPHTLTLDDWIEALRKRGHDVLTEHQVKVKVETYGHLAHLWSTYELRLQPDGPPTVRGINSIQAVFDGKRWRVLEILWQAETPDQPIPEKYLP